MSPDRRGFRRGDPAGDEACLDPGRTYSGQRGQSRVDHAYDFLDHSVLGSRVTEKAISFRQSLGKRSAEIWNGGPSPRDSGGRSFERDQGPANVSF